MTMFVAIAMSSFAVVDAEVEAAFVVVSLVGLLGLHLCCG